MAKSSNPMQEHHRQKRQRKIQKNKQQRIKARDEKVVATKTVAMVQEEIRNLKRRKNLQSSEQQKLQRLEKELKLVKAAASKQPRSHYQPSAPAKPLTDLDDPRKSVYYDEKLNPYGAPPPGRPRLFHKLGGGVTMNVKEAVVPGEEPPPPQPKKDLSQQVSDKHKRDIPAKRRPEAEADKTAKTSDGKISVKEPPSQVQDTAEIANDASDRDTPDQVDKPLVVPTLPAPSKAVLRGRRGKATVDIWATTEEVDYELRANMVDLEADDVGAAAPKKTKKKKVKKPPLEFYYKDRSGQVQGPYPKLQMQQWFSAGFFPPTTLVKTNRNDNFLPMSEVQSLQPEPVKNEADNGIQDRIAALKGDSVEDRIAALKQTSSVEDRIAALKSEETVEDRIAALKGEQAVDMPHSEPNHNGENGLAPPPPPPPPPPQPNATSDAMDLTYPVVDGEVPPYPVEDTYPSNDTTAPPYPIDESNAVAPYPIDDEPPAYPLDEGAPSYPVEAAAYDTPYPTVDDSSYPVADPYPAVNDSNYPVADPYPATDAYPYNDNPDDLAPVQDEFTQGPSMEPRNETKKVIKVDKDVVAFLPSNLQNKKRKAPQATNAANKRTPNMPDVAPKDDYDKFMQEIEGL